MLNIPFAEGAYDYVVCRSLLPHVERWRDAIVEMLRVSREGVVFHHNTAEFLPKLKEKGRSRFVASREDLENLGAEKIIPVAALVIDGHMEKIEAALSCPARYYATLNYERIVLPCMPLECASKFIATISKPSLSSRT